MEEIVISAEHDSASVAGCCYALKGMYPFVKLRRVGKSVLGREIIGAQIGSGEAPVLFCAGFHGSERVAGLLILRYFHHLCDAWQRHSEIAGVRARRALDGRALLVIPAVNPDGWEIALRGPAAATASPPLAAKIERLCGKDHAHWNANARGVDINHNFDAGWAAAQALERQHGIYGPSRTRYGGVSPESEPETAALAALCRSVPFAHALAFHSQGEEIYWNYGEHTPAKALRMAQIFASSSGYTLSEPEGIASHAGFKDWFIDEFHRPGFTIEVGRGTNPLPPESLDEIYARLEEMMTLAIIC